MVSEMSTDDLQTVAWFWPNIGKRIRWDRPIGGAAEKWVPLIRGSDALARIEALERERDAALANLEAALSLHTKARAERDAALAENAKLYRTALSMGDVIDNHCLAMQAAVIEMYIGKGAEAGMRWIENTLAGPGLYPDVDEAQELGGAQAWFDAKSAETRAGKELAALVAQEGAKT